MSILKLLNNKYYKLAYECGLALSGTEEGRPLFIGTTEQMNKYWRALENNNL
jgi:hypothetical protein